MDSPGGITNASSIAIIDVSTLKIALRKPTRHMEEWVRDATSDECIIEKILLQCIVYYTFHHQVQSEVSKFIGGRR